MTDPAPGPGVQRGRFLVLGLLLLFVPLFRASNRPLPLLVAELLSLGLLLYTLRFPPQRLPLPRGLWLAGGLILLVPLLQLLPLPGGLWQHLPGQAHYYQALQTAGVVPDTRPLSLIPYATEQAWLRLLLPIAVFLVAIGLPTERLRRLGLLLIAMAAGQALLGLLQIGDGADSPLRFGNRLMGDSAVGTYVNRNHLAGLLIMSLPMVLGMLAASVGRGDTDSSEHTLRQRLASLGGLRYHRLLIYAALTLVILIGLVFTRSRAGIGLGMLGILLAAMLFAHRLGGRNVYGLLGTVLALGLVAAVEIGLAPVLERFSGADALDDERWEINAATLHTIGEFFPLGSGMGTYPEVFRRFQPQTVPGFINRAHNDFLEWLSGGGLPIAVALVLILWEYCRRWPRVLDGEAWTRFHFLQVGAGLGLLLIGLHSLVDFNLHIPANATYCALLAALFWHPYQPPAQRRRRRRAGALPEPPPASSEAIPNPFAD